VQTTEQLERILPDYPGVRSLVVPTRLGGQARAMMFYYGFKLDPATNQMSVDPPGTVYMLDAKAGRIVSARPYEGPPRVYAPRSRGIPSDVHEERVRRWRSIQDELAPEFFRGGDRPPAAFEAQAAEYRTLFSAIVDPELVPYYLELAPDWCAWVGVEAHDAGP
jgi:hypothetical protein